MKKHTSRVHGRLLEGYGMAQNRRQSARQGTVLFNMVMGPAMGGEHLWPISVPTTKTRQ